MTEQYRNWLQAVTALSAISWMLPAMAAPPAPAAVVPSTPASQQSHVVASDPALQNNVTIDVVGRTIEDVLAQLSQTASVKLNATRTIADQRITLHITDKPLHEVMERLTGLLSHAPTSPRGYHWEKLNRPTGERPAYRLWRDAQSRIEERAALDQPWQDALQHLKDSRNLARLPGEERSSYKSSFPPASYAKVDLNPLCQALKNLSDAQLEALMRGTDIYIPTAPLKEALAAQYKALWERFKPDDPMPAFALRSDTMTLRVVRHDDGGERPNQSHIFGLAMGQGKVTGLINGYTHLNGYEETWGEGLLPEKDDPKAPVFDLAPLLAAKEVTPEQRGDIGFTLAALAKTAKISLYQEHFFKTNHFGRRSEGIQKLKGTLPQLINAICREWGYQVEKVGEDYFFWSRTWAQDRAADVPERALDRWRKRSEKQQGNLTPENRMEIASSFTWPQVKLTLNLALPESGPWDMLREYRALRFLRQLSHQERTAAASEQGLAVAALSSAAQGTLLTELDFRTYANILGREDRLTAERVENARLFLRRFAPNISLEVTSDEDTSLWSVRSF